MRAQDPANPIFADPSGDRAVLAALEQNWASDRERSKKLGRNNRAGPRWPQAHHVDVGAAQPCGQLIFGRKGHKFDVRIGGGYARTKGAFLVASNAKHEFSPGVPQLTSQSKSASRFVGKSEVARVKQRQPRTIK